MSRTDLVQRPSYHLEQRFHRRWPEAAAQVTQSFLRRHGTAMPCRPAVSLPTPRVAQPWEHPEREQEIHPSRRQQITQPALRRPGLLQDLIDQLGRQVLGFRSNPVAAAPAAPAVQK